MISLISLPERVIQGESIIIELKIEGKLKKTYYGKYINLNIKKNGSTYTKILYPQRYNNEPLIWNVNQNSYSLYGTFNVNAFIQNESSIISSTTFIIEEKCIVNKVDISNNLSDYKNKQNIKDNYQKNNEINESNIIYNIQKPNQQIIETVKTDIIEINNDLLNKVQKSLRNVNQNF